MFGKRKLDEMPPPPQAAGPDAHEVARLWIVGGALHVSLRRAFADPAAWGIALVDVARHAARSYAAEGDISEAEALDRIASIIRAELDSPTDLGTTVAVQ